jgi:zinc protease
VHAVLLLSAILGWGEASALSERLQLRTNLVSAPWCTYNAGRLAGNLHLGFSPAEHDLPAALTNVHDLIESIRRGQLSSARLNRTREAILAQTLFNHETVDGLASDAAWFAARLGQPQAAAAHRRKLRAVGPREVVDAARTWMNPANAVLVYSDPDVDPAEVQHAWQPRSPPRSATAPTGPVHRELDNGARIVVLPDEGHVACIRMAVVGGALAIGNRQAGLAAAWTELMRAGCGPWDAIEFARHLDGLGATFGASVGASLLNLRCSFLATELEEAMDLFARLVRQPRFASDQWHRIQDELLDDLLGLSDRQEEVAERAQDAALWPGHPWRLPWGGTEASLGRLTPAAIRRWHQAQMDPRRMVLAVAGGVDVQQTLDLASDWMQHLVHQRPLPARPQVAPVQHRQLRRRAGQHQATLVAMVRTGGTHDADRRALELAATVLDGAVGRLFMVLREQLALGYDVWASHSVGLDGGALTAGLSTAPASMPAATVALLGELRRLAADGPGEDELARCCSLLAGELAAGLQQVSARAALCATGIALDRPWDPATIAGERAAVTPDNVRQALANVGIADPVLLSVLPR